MLVFSQTTDNWVHVFHSLLFLELMSEVRMTYFALVPGLYITKRVLILFVCLLCFSAVFLEPMVVGSVMEDAVSTAEGGGGWKEAVGVGSVVTKWPSRVRLEVFPLLQPREGLGGPRESGRQ